MASGIEMNLAEKELFKHTLQRNYDEVKRLLTVDKVSVNCFDEDGMTPLQHAAYKGDYNLCKLLLDYGADVNLSNHTSQYSALTFAGLSGKIDVVSLLLEHGASVSKVNSINKTAAQMAAFVGNHNVVNIINNFIPLEEIEYFTKIQGLETEPKLPPFLCSPVHKMAVKTNIHPVCLVLYMLDNLSILDNSKNICRVFNILCEKQLKNEGNELLSLKFHHLAFIINTCQKFIDEQKSKSESAGLDTNELLNRLIKYWIKGDKNGFPIVLEKLLHQDVKEYPYVECGMFRQLVRTLAPVKIGEEPSAITIISEVVNGQRGLDNSIACFTCGEPGAEKKCSACKSVYYCSKNCQKLHWFTHKTICSDLKVKYLDASESESVSKSQENAELKEENVST